MKGRVTINGFDLRDLKQQSARGVIGIVSQEPVLFNDTILHNIRYGKLDATMEEVEAAAKV